jgi:hypothetical protein
MSDDRATDWRRDQATRYLATMFGPDWIYRAPETFEGVNRWIWAVANEQPDFGEKCIGAIEARPAAAWWPKARDEVPADPLAGREESLREAGVAEGTIGMMRP